MYCFRRQVWQYYLTRHLILHREMKSLILLFQEKERKKRLLEMAPRRASNRLEGKRKDQEEQVPNLFF